MFCNFCQLLYYNAVFLCSIGQVMSMKLQMHSLPECFLFVLCNRVVEVVSIDSNFYSERLLH